MLYLTPQVFRPSYPQIPDGLFRVLPARYRGVYHPFQFRVIGHLNLPAASQDQVYNSFSDLRMPISDFESAHRQSQIINHRSSIAFQWS